MRSKIVHIDSWFLRYIKNYKEKPMFYASYGSFIHKLLELYYLGILNKDDMLADFLSNFSTEVRGSRPSGNVVSKYIKAGSDYFKTFEPFDGKTLGAETKVKFKVGERDFVGFVDFIGEKDGELYIVDNKSRELKSRSQRKKPTAKDQELDSMLRQLYLYSAAIKQRYGTYPDWLCFNCFRNKKFIKERFDKDKYQETLDWATKTIENISNAESFPPSVEFFKCKYLCGFNDICCYASPRSA